MVLIVRLHITKHLFGYELYGNDMILRNKIKCHGPHQTFALFGACSIPKLTIRIPQEGGHGVLPQPNYFNFGQRKLAHQRCAIINNTTLQCMLNNSHCE